MNDRRKMAWDDWINAALLAAVGLFLGIAAQLMTQLSAAFWPVAILSILLFAGVIAFDLTLDRVSERIFSGKIRPPRNPKPAGRRPLALLLGLPAGVVFGFALGALGLADDVLGLMQ